MRVSVRVMPRAKKDEVLPGDPLRVHVTAAPVDGKANAAVCKLLAKHYGVRKSAVRVVSGETARTKIVEVEGVADETGAMRTKRQEPPRGGRR